MRLSRVDRYEDSVNARRFAFRIQLNAEIKLLFTEQHNVLVANKIVVLVVDTTLNGLSWDRSEQNNRRYGISAPGQSYFTGNISNCQEKRRTNADWCVRFFLLARFNYMYYNDLRH